MTQLFLLPIVTFGTLRVMTLRAEAKSSATTGADEQGHFYQDRDEKGLMAPYIRSSNIERRIAGRGHCVSIVISGANCYCPLRMAQVEAGKSPL